MIKTVIENNANVNLKHAVYRFLAIILFLLFCLIVTIMNRKWALKIQEWYVISS